MRLFTKRYIVVESKTNNGKDKSGEIIINSRFLRNSIGEKVKVVVYTASITGRRR